MSKSSWELAFCAGTEIHANALTGEIEFKRDTCNTAVFAVFPSPVVVVVEDAVDEDAALVAVAADCSELASAPPVSQSSS